MTSPNPSCSFCAKSGNNVTVHTKGENVFICESCVSGSGRLILEQPRCPGDFIASMFPEAFTSINLADALLLVGEKRDSGNIPVGELLTLLVQAVVPEPKQNSPSDEELKALNKTYRQITDSLAKCYGMQQINLETMDVSHLDLGIGTGPHWHPLSVCLDDPIGVLMLRHRFIPFSYHETTDRFIVMIVTTEPPSEQMKQKLGEYFDVNEGNKNEILYLLTPQFQFNKIFTRFTSL